MSGLSGLKALPQLNPDFAFECSHNCLMHLKVALSIVLIVIMELSLNRSIKNLNLAALKDRDN